MSDPKDYTVGWICAITTEYVAAQSFLDEEHDGPEQVSINDNNDYTLGKIGKHNVVMAVLPDGEYGLSSAASVARDMLHSFPNVRIGLMVGIGGGAPSKKHDIRLGDIVVSAARDGKGGVFQYDFGKTIQDQSFQFTGLLNQPPTVLRTALSGLRSQYERKGHQLEQTVNSILESNKRLRQKYSRPVLDTDILYKTEVVHPYGNENKTSCAELCGDSPSNLIIRSPRTEDDDNPSVHYGIIASANQLMKDASLRDSLAAEKGILCFEMEAAGLMNHFPCLVIRGICDYSDSHKNKAWQGYAAMTAAAYAKDLLCRIPPNKIEAERKIVDIMSDVKTQVVDMSRDVRSIAQKQLNREMQDILDWLTPVDYFSQQNDFIARHQAETGQWLLMSKKFQDWVSQKKQTLFCPGIPGAGKTIATSIVVSYLHQRFQDDTNIGVAYIYLNFRQQSQQQPIDILSSILKQFAHQGGSVHDGVRMLFDDHKLKQTRPTFIEIAQVLHQVVAGYSRAYIIIDALDEYTNSTEYYQPDIMSEVFRLQDRTGANLFVTSRFIPHIKKEFENRGCIMLEIRATVEDMRRYLDSGISQLPQFVSNTLGLEDKIKSAIIQAADGMFLLSKLHLDSLRDKISPMQVEDVLRNLPKGLDAYQIAYHRAMERIQSQRRGLCDLARRILSWITCCIRPLSTVELQHALAVILGASGLDARNLTDTGLMTSVCVGLVTIDEHSGIIRLVHYTAQEYFEQTWALWFPGAQIDIARTCITYLLFDDFEAGMNPSFGDFKDRLRSNVLYDYAASNWGYHARAASSLDVDRLAVDLLESEDKVPARNQEMLAFRGNLDSSSRSLNTTGLHLAAHFGLKGPIMALLNKHHNPDAEINGYTPLYLAAKEGHEDVVELLLENDANPDAWNINYSPLRSAVERGHVGVAKLLLESGAVDGRRRFRELLSSASKTGNIALVKLLLPNRSGLLTNSDYYLHHAAQHGHEEIVKLLIEVYDGLEFTDSWSLTPLHYAATNGHVAIVKLLSENGADAQIKGYGGLTPLHYASSNGYVAVTKLLSENGADADIKDDMGLTPLHHASCNGHGAVASLLIELGAQVNHKDESWQTPLFKAAEYGHEAVVKLLLENGALAQIKDDKSLTPLHYASNNGHGAVVSLLIEWGAHVNSEGRDSQTPLLQAAQNGHEAVIGVLLKKGADPNIEDYHGNTALSEALENEHEKVARTLLENGANWKTKDRYGNTPLRYAARKGYEAIVKLFLDNSFDLNPGLDKGYSPLHAAAIGGHEAIMKLLLDNGAYIGHSDYWADYLHTIASYGHEATMRLLLENGIDPNCRCGDEIPLLNAIWRKHEALVKLLIEGGADVNVCGKHGETPLARAASGKDITLVKLLLKHGADPNIKHRDGPIPLDEAASRGHEAIVKLLLEAGAEVEPQNGNGEYAMAPLQNALKGQHEAIVKILLDKGAELESKNENGWYDRISLCYAAYSGYETMAKLFLQKRTNPRSPYWNGDNELALYKALERNHEAVVKLLLDHGVTPNSRDAYKLPDMAVKSGNETIVKMVLEKGAHAWYNNLLDSALLKVAAEKGYTAIVRLLLDKGVSPEATLYTSMPPLHCAAHYGHETVTKLLLDRGANPNLISSQGKTPLHEAAERGHEAIANLLLKRGANTDLRNCNNETPLYTAIAYNHHPTIKLLFRSGAKLAVGEREGRIPLLYSQGEVYQQIKCLLEVGASTELQDRQSGQALLLVATHYNYTPVIKLLLANNANPTVAGVNGQTPLHAAAEMGYLLAARLLLERGVNPDIGDKSSTAPLHLAACYGQPAMVQLLLQKGANLSLKRFDGDTPLHIAAYHGREAIVMLLLDRGANVESRNDYGETPLHKAAIGHKAIVSLLLEAGANPEVKNCVDETPLYIAAERGCDTIIKLLLGRGADLEAKSSCGLTPLYAAVEGGHETATVLLLERGACLNVEDISGNTPLHEAVAHKYETIVKLLLDRGVNLKAKNVRGETPLQIATKKRYEGIVKLLIDMGA